MSFRYTGGLITAGSPVNANYPSGVWTNQQAATYINGQVWGQDPYFENTTLLLHGDGTNGAQNNTFLDSSTNNFTITRNGNTTQGTFSPFSKQDGYWGNYFDGTGDDLTVASNAALQLASESNWTVEFWGYFVSTPDDFDVILGKGTASGNYEYFFEAFADRTIDILYSGNGTTTWTGQHQLTPAIPLNTWFHFAAVRNGATFKSYVNGVEYFSGSSFNIYAGSGVLNIGGYSGAAGQDPNMYLSNVRIVKGTAVYTSNFTPSTTPLTAITNTSLLTCQSNRFIDNSSNNFAITRNGDVRVTPFAPFQPLIAYSPTVTGGSGYFDGTGDYLSSSITAIGTSNFTIEYWSYLTAHSGANGEGGYFQISGTSGGLSTTYTVGVFATRSAPGAGRILQVNVGNTNIDTTYVPPLNTWFHTAIVRSSNSVSVYVNGTLVSTPATISTNLTGTNCAVGGYYSTSYLCTGYISGFRVVNSAVYTSAFTPPTAPLTAISNTSLLLSGTNAGILDNTMSNNLETVGNAQIDTSIVKYGTGSMEFDGSGDYLICPVDTTPYYEIVNRSWTLESWVYLTTSALRNLASCGPANAGSINRGWAIAIHQASSIVYFSSVGADNTYSSVTMPLNSWFHLAFVYNGTSLVLYINGVNVGSKTPSLANPTIAGGDRLVIGSNYTGGSSYFSGFMDDFRFTQGIARYTTNFTPPIARLPNQ
jgi:hypothetical protein